MDRLEAHVSLFRRPFQVSDARKRTADPCGPGYGAFRVRSVEEKAYLDGHGSLTLSVAPLELLDLSGGVYKLLLSGVEGMTI